MVWLPPAVLASGARVATREPIVTDRPDFTESASVVPSGLAQIESGATYERSGNDRALSLPESLLRKGMGGGWEIRLGIPSFVSERSGGESRRGFGDLYIGGKVEIGSESAAVRFALIPGAIIPYGDRELRADAWTPQLAVVWAANLAQGRSLSGMLAVEAPEESGKRKSLWRHTLSLGVPLNERSGLFFEHVLDFGHGSAAEHLAHAGWTHRPSPDRQWDVHIGMTLGRASTASFVGVGYAVRG